MGIIKYTNFIVNMEQLLWSGMEMSVVGQPISDLTTNQYNAMLAGIVYGLIDQNHLTEFETCISDGRSEATAAFKGFEDLWHHQWLTGFKELGSVVEALPHMLKDCTSIQDDIASLEAWGQVFLDPKSLPATVKSNVTHNLIKLTRDLNKAKNDWKNEQYFAFGEELGDMLVIATTPGTNEEILGQPISDLTTNQYNAMLAGVVYGLIDQNHLTEIETCISDGRTEGTKVFHAFEDLWQHDWLTGVKELGSVVEALPHMLKDCTSI